MYWYSNAFAKTVLQMHSVLGDDTVGYAEGARVSLWGRHQTHVRFKSTSGLHASRQRVRRCQFFDVVCRQRPRTQLRGARRTGQDPGRPGTRLGALGAKFGAYGAEHEAIRTLGTRNRASGSGAVGSRLGNVPARNGSGRTEPCRCVSMPKQHVGDGGWRVAGVVGGTECVSTASVITSFHRQRRRQLRRCVKAIISDRFSGHVEQSVRCVCVCPRTTTFERNDIWPRLVVHLDCI